MQNIAAIKCKLCGKEFKSLSGHLHAKHGISSNDYKRLYPLSLINSTDLTREIKKSHTVLKNCKTCGRGFTVYKSEKKNHCSFKCSRISVSKKNYGLRRSKNRKKTVCANCKKEKEIYQYSYRTNKNVFCDRTCYLKFHKVKHKIKKCKNATCNNTFSWTKTTDPKYCSRRCYKIDYDRDKNFDKTHYKGYYISIRSNKKIWYDSSYELTRMKQLDMDSAVLSWERFSDKIPYTIDGEEHFYRPDFLVKYKGETVVEEIKGKLYAKDVLKIRAGQIWCHDKNLKYKILNYNDIYGMDSLEPAMEKYKNKYGEFYRISILYAFIKTAQFMAERSTCLRSSVGCVIAPLNLYNFYSIGYNGSVKGAENGCKSLEPGKCGCIHAERNALKKIDELNIKMDDSLLITTLAPCFSCANEIIKYPIKKVIYLKTYRDQSGIKFLRSNGIEVVKYQELLLKSNRQLYPK